MDLIPGEEEVSEPPVRICCGQRHFGAQCPDGLVMCCLCFERVPVDRLVRDATGAPVDVCLRCDDEQNWEQIHPV